MNYIVDDIGLVVDRVRERFLTLDSTVLLISSRAITMDGGGPPFYLYGHRREIANRLSKKGVNASEKYKKYPLIALRLDTSERVVGDMTHYTLNLAIVHATKPGYTAEERYINVFKPILYPLYDLFMEELRNTGGFWWEGQRSRPEHIKIDRPFYGVPSNEGNVKQLFADPLDAIEIVDLKISKRIVCD